MKKVLWFRRDLRVHDSMLLAIEGEVLPIFIFDTNILNALEKNDKRVSFIFEQVLKLKTDLKALGLDLALFYGTPLEVFTCLKTLGVSEVYASVDYDSYAKERDAKIAEMLSFHSLNDCYLFEPNEVLKKDGSPYLVFTPYYRACQALYTKFYALEYNKAEQSLVNFDCNALWCIQDGVKTALHVKLESIGFASLHVNILSPEKALEIFTCKVDAYAEKRDFLDEDATSHLSVHLRFGTISIREVVRFLVYLKQQGHATEPFFRQLIFREFYAYLLFHFPKLAWENYKYAPPISNDEDAYTRFISAQTGYPLIDAAVTELLTTGLMHNRARMVVGSFFTKHLMLPWQKGEAFFAKYLLDYDASANILSWQWCAGTGIDPQPYFRIFNPYAQSLKFDREADYIKRFLPQLHDIPASCLHKETYLMSHDITGYPKPLIGHESARKRFLSEFSRTH
ncbi:cryptochrome/photolyase family protein [Sulfurospirillum multivorans]|uniref:Deoxyribodipyrimidine photolyase n=2 Tax=Sulfurospirillum multivorans TaxID=66821 RepID=A0AA86ALD7_SULMK|nr:deoxyribodipyrimidine photo-lyase [Sulfurospirillum multivorans]AHJ12629.1 deoxyribodipyrimidine photolyase [Sulfurospirillum multivorans DSM 12446]QEH06124.1 deoxyribodipyrimidine photolyase [Sulfurospirillum multivorans]